MEQILIVEDNPDNLMLATLLLRSEGYTVLCAENAPDGLEVARTDHPDLILMDIQLPGMDGVKASQELKSDPETDDIPIVALTAYAMKGDKERLLGEGFDGYISKPFFREEFISSVKKYLQSVSESV